MYSQTTEVTELLERLAPKSAKLPRLHTKQGKLTDVKSGVKSQNAAGASVLGDLKLVAEA